MPQAWQVLRSGAWLTPARAYGYSIILLSVYAIAIVGTIALSKGFVDYNGKPIGTDFSSFYAAGALALEGKAAAAYNMTLHYAREQQLFGASTPYFGWLYPPTFFVLAAPLALLPYPLALIVWQGLTLALYMAVMATILYEARRRSDTIANLWLPVASAFPAVFINLGHGQNGFLSAAIFGAALVSLPQHPIMAGALFGLLAYKPQLALVIPFALLAAGQWRVIAAAAITTMLLASISVLLFGADAWWSFLASTETSRTLLLEEGGVGFEKLQSIFAAVRLWGGSVTLAYAFQGTVSSAAICGTAWIWRSSQHRKLKAALLLSAATVASPHILDYDLMLLAPSIAFIVLAKPDAQLRSYEITLLAAVWVAPLLARTIAGLTGAPIGFLASLTLFVLIVRIATRNYDVAPAT